MGNLYTKMKIFHFKEKVDSLPPENPEILPPLHIRIKPTNICNHNCGYCAYRADNLQLGQDMDKGDSIPKDKMMEIIDDIVEMGVKAVTFSGGGEPLIYPHLAETLKKLRDSPVKFASLTNGSRLTGEIAELFAHHGTWVRVSMDGWDPESYAAYRNVSEDEFRRVMDNIERFKKLAGPCYLGVSFIVDRKNAGQINQVLTRLKDLGVDSVKVSPCIVSNLGPENNAYHEPIFTQVKEQIVAARAGLEDESFEIFDSYHALDEKFAKNYTWCPYQQILPVIGADCRIYSCQDKAYNLHHGVLGSVREKRFRDFWLADKKNFFSIRPDIHCDHHCVANSKNILLHEYLNADREHLGFV